MVKSLWSALEAQHHRFRKTFIKLFQMAGIMGLMIVSATLTSDLLSQLVFRSIFTNFATKFHILLFNYSVRISWKVQTFSMKFTHYLFILNNNVLPIEFQYSASARRYSTWNLLPGGWYYRTCRIRHKPLVFL